LQSVFAIALFHLRVAKDLGEKFALAETTVARDPFDSCCSEFLIGSAGLLLKIKLDFVDFFFVF
jgi:hypothetical protein